MKEKESYSFAKLFRRTQKMKSFVMIVVAVMWLIVDAADITDDIFSSQCKWNDIDAGKDVPSEVVSFGFQGLIGSLGGSFGLRMISISDAKSQNVNGKIYQFDIHYEYTTCLSSVCYDDINDSTICPNVIKTSSKCTVMVFYQPWTYTLRFNKAQITCTE